MIAQIDSRLRNPNPQCDVLPCGSVLTLPWYITGLRKREKAYPYALFMVGLNKKVRSENYSHYMGYWLFQDKGYHIDGKINLAGWKVRKQIYLHNFISSHQVPSTLIFMMEKQNLDQQSHVDPREL